MASGRRGGPPDLKSTLGSLFRTTLEQVGAVKDAVEQQARGRGGLIDQALEQRRRKEAMARLGERIYRLAQSGELGELALDPKVGLCLEEIDAIDSDSGHSDWRDDDESFRSHEDEALSSKSFVPRPPAASDGEYRVWRPTRPNQPEAADSAKATHVEAPAAAQPIGRSARLPRKTAQRSGSTIRFVEENVRPEDPACDDDLEAYMHDDDVPEKD